MKIFSFLMALLLPVIVFADTVSDAKLYAYETASGMPMGAVFGTLPQLSADDELISVTSPTAGQIEIHRMQDENGIMKMRRVDALPVPKNTNVTLDATGYHLMLMKLSAPLKDGQNFPLTLTFKNAGDIQTDVPVTTRKAKK